MYTRKLLIICLGLLLPVLAVAQEPASVKWMQVKTDRFQVIYPGGYDSAAMRCAAMLNAAYDHVWFSMKHKPRPISIILHNQNSMSNGMVALCPRRSEFWQTPMQETLHPFDWTGGLVLHEFRHVVQFDMLNQGFGKFLYIFMGEYGIGLKSIFSPNWFYEGDAVATETALSPAGRGRSADFKKVLKAQVLDKKIYSYSKATLGSYRDYVPNHYYLGYNLITYGRNKWGADLWRNAHTMAARRIGLRPFSNAISARTGTNKEKFYRNALTDLKTYWGDQTRKELIIESNNVKIPERNVWTNYKYPQYINDEEIIALKSGMSDIPTIVKIGPGGEEDVLARVPLITDGNPVNNNGKYIVWAEETPHVRWTEKSYSDIFTYNILEGKRHQLTRGTYYFSPDISPDGRVIAVEVTRKSTYYIVILHANSGKVLKRIAAPGTDFIMTPRWSADGKSAVCVLLNSKGKRITRIDTETGAFSNLTQPSFTDVSNPFIHDNYLVYTSEVNGENEVYALDTTTKQLYQVTVNKFGSRYPSVYNGMLLFSYYTADGYSIGQQQFKRSKWYTSDKIIYKKDTLVDALLKDEMGVPDIFQKETLDSGFVKKPYRKVLHMFNTHSWGIIGGSFGYDSENPELQCGITSQDKLSTTIFNLGYKADNLGSSKFFTDFYYQGLFPILQLSFEKGYHGFEYGSKNRGLLSSDPFYFYERTVFSQSVTIPLNFSKGAYYRKLSLSAANQYQSLGKIYRKYYSGESWSRSQIGDYDGKLDYLNYQLSLQCIQYQPLKNILPRLGLTLVGGFAHGLPVMNDRLIDVSSKVYIKGDVYLPGLFRHHTLHLMCGNAYNQKDGQIDPSHPVPFARGYLSQSTTSEDLTSLRANYTFTLFNPDAALLSLLYVNRVYSTVFVDYTEKNFHPFMSKGFELFFKTYVLNIPTPINVGFRQSFIEDGSTFEFIFGISE